MSNEQETTPARRSSARTGSAATRSNHRPDVPNQQHPDRAIDAFQSDIQAKFPSHKYWSWREELRHEEEEGAHPTSSPVLQFDAKALEEDRGNRDAHLLFLDGMALCGKLALVVTNFVDLEPSIWTAESLLAHYKLTSRGRAHHKCFTYEIIKGPAEIQQKTGFPYQHKGWAEVPVDKLAEEYQQICETGSAGGLQAPPPKQHFHYIKDFSFHDNLPSWNQSFRKNCRIPEILPAGDWCLLTEVSSNTEDGSDSSCSIDVQKSHVCNFWRADAPPLLSSFVAQKSTGNLTEYFGMGYISPRGGVTLFHEDAEGMMDACHYVVEGYNHVIIFPWLSTEDVGQLKQEVPELTFEVDLETNNFKVGTPLKYPWLAVLLFSSSFLGSLMVHGQMAG